MSAQPSDQIGGSTPTSSLFRSLRGSFSQGSVASVSTQSQAVPAEPVASPVVAPPVTSAPPSPPPEIIAAPIELDQMAQEVTENSDTSVEESSLPAAELAGEETSTLDTPEVVTQEAFEAAAPVVEPTSVESMPETVPQEVVSEPALDPEPVAQSAQAVPQADVLAAALPSAVNEMTDTLNPPMAGGGMAKEAPLLSVTVEHPAVDQAGGVQYVETEKSHELPPEVEGFIKKVEDNIDQIPQEVVISDPQSGQQLPRVLATPVVVLPITPKTEDEGKRKSESYSIRWLIEWSWKMMKTFSGKVVYRDESSES